MRISQLFGQTLREAPAEAEVASHQLLLRAGFIRQLASGVFSYLPLARRSMNKIEAIVREEIEAIGGQEVTMPVVQPAEIWKKTGRWQQIDAEMGRFKDRNQRDMVLAMTHEEVVADLASKEIHSYRQLPVLIYHIQTKWRDDPRPRAGLIRVREFSMKDSYSLDRDWEGLDRQYRNHYQAYFRIFKRCALPVTTVKSDVGMMGGKLAHEFMYLTPIGEDTLMFCDQCGYSSNRQLAQFRKKYAEPEVALPVEKVATPQCKTIAELADFLGVAKSKTAKAVFLVATILEDEKVEEKFVFVVVRGDMDVNETKLANLIQARALRPATEDEIRSVGAEPGYASPVGLENIPVIMDDAILASSNLVAGANEAGFHLLNVNYGRDFRANVVADIVSAQAGDPCPQCGASLRAERGVEVGNIFKLGVKYSEAMNCTYLDESGQPQPVVMGSYGIGIGRLLACIAEAHHDEYGLVWPPAIAPFDVHLVLLKGKGTPEAEEIAEKLYAELKANGLDVLYDDRGESPGVKFNTADLIGAPVRITVSERAIKAGGVEFKRRDLDQRQVLPMQDLIPHIKEELLNFQALFESQASVRVVEDF